MHLHTYACTRIHKNIHIHKHIYTHKIIHLYELALKCKYKVLSILMNKHTRTRLNIYSNIMMLFISIFFFSTFIVFFFKKNHDFKIILSTIFHCTALQNSNFYIPDLPSLHLILPQPFPY